MIRKQGKMRNNLYITGFVILLGCLCFADNAAAQLMQEKKNKIGIKTGVSMNWMLNQTLNADGQPERYQPIPRQGLQIAVYSRSRMTKFIKAFDYRSDVKNWYFQYELGAGYRGGNYNYTVKQPDGSYNSSDTGRFRKISTFVIEMPFMFVWDYKNRQKLNLMGGVQLQYIVNTELYKSNDPSPLFYASEQYDDLVKYNPWGASGVFGFQLMGEYVGFQMLAKYGLTDMNKRMAIGLDASGNINRTIPGYLKPFSIDFNIVF
jgi:hypothetical protein